jgi:DNA adenine methylase
VTQLDLVIDGESPGPSSRTSPLRSQLLKWIGNKQRFAPEILGFFPTKFRTYFEPFLGSGAVLGSLGPSKGIGSDVLDPLIGIWRTVKADPELVKSWYRSRWERMRQEGKIVCYESVKAAYNRSPNPSDLLFLARSCYGGVVRFRHRDAAISTPCGIHQPVTPDSFDRRVDIWHARVQGTEFISSDFEAVMDSAGPGDLIYCDPPYSHTQAILYGAQAFSLERLLGTIERCKSRDVQIVLSIDGSKKSGNTLCDIPLPQGLFARELFLNCGRSMLRRFQMRGETLGTEEVRDRLLLTY